MNKQRVEILRYYFPSRYKMQFYIHEVKTYIAVLSKILTMIEGTDTIRGITMNIIIHILNHFFFSY